MDRFDRLGVFDEKFILDFIISIIYDTHEVKSESFQTVSNYRIEPT